MLGGCRTTERTVCTRLSMGITRIDDTRSTRISWSSQNSGILCEEAEPHTQCQLVPTELRDTLREAEPHTVSAGPRRTPGYSAGEHTQCQSPEDQLVLAELRDTLRSKERCQRPIVTVSEGKTATAYQNVSTAHKLHNDSCRRTKHYQN